jgi:hypothetical protein
MFSVSVGEFTARFPRFARKNLNVWYEKGVLYESPNRIVPLRIKE